MLAEHLGGHNGITHLDDGALNWFKILGYKTFLDIGCGLGGMVQLAEQKGFIAYGIDGDYTVKRYDTNKFLIHDFTTGPVFFTKIFDIGWSVEFVEHVCEEFVPNYARAMQHCKNLVMTYAPKGHGGHHHVNEQNEVYWINKMAAFGFLHDKNLTKELRKVSTMGTKKKHQFVKRTGLFFINEKI